MKNKGTYLYGAVHRPISSVSVPKDFLEIGKHPEFREFGSVTYGRQLSIEERINHGLRAILSEKQLADLVATIATEAGFSEYPNEWIEEDKEDPKTFELGIGQIIDKHCIHADRKHVLSLMRSYLESIRKR
jgi:hypothetical protein